MPLGSEAWPPYSKHQEALDDEWSDNETPWHQRQPRPGGSRGARPDGRPSRLMRNTGKLKNKQNQVQLIS